MKYYVLTVFADTRGGCVLDGPLDSWTKQQEYLKVRKDQHKGTKHDIFLLESQSKITIKPV